MAKNLRLLTDTETLRRKLSRDPIHNSGFIWRVFGRGDTYLLYASDDLGAILAVQSTGDHITLAGDWSGMDMPVELLPEKGFFVSASPPEAVELLKGCFALAGEWPCWHFLAPQGYGPGEWDDMDSLTAADVPFVASHWELGGDDREEHIRESVKRFESACIRVDGSPISWCGLHFETESVGNLGFAHTLEEHRKKGYAKLVTKALVNRLHRKGKRATAGVIKDNAASIATCKSLGFTVVGEETWADFKKRE